MKSINTADSTVSKNLLQIDSQGNPDNAAIISHDTKYSVKVFCKQFLAVNSFREAYSKKYLIRQTFCENIPCFSEGKNENRIKNLVTKCVIFRTAAVEMNKEKGQFMLQKPQRKNLSLIKLSRMRDVSMNFEMVLTLQHSPNEFPNKSDQKSQNDTHPVSLNVPLSVSVNFNSHHFFTSTYFFPAKNEKFSADFQ